MAGWTVIYYDDLAMILVRDVGTFAGIARAVTSSCRAQVRG